MKIKCWEGVVRGWELIMGWNCKPYKYGDL